MGIFTKRHAIAWIIIPAIGKSVNMRGIHNAATINCYKTVTSKGACVIVGRNDRQAKSRFASLLNRRRSRIGCGLTKNIGISWHRNVQ